MKNTEPHFLQTKAWEDVRKNLGQDVVRIGEDLMHIKHLGSPFKNFGIIMQGSLETVDWEDLEKVVKEKKLSHVHFDPSDTVSEATQQESLETVKTRISQNLSSHHSIVHAESIYYRHTLVLDLTKSEEQLLTEMHKKHRYNIRVSEKHGVKIEICEDDEALTIFIKLFFKTVNRQGYFGRSPEYYRTIWKTLKPMNKVKIAVAEYQGKPLVAWMLFLGEKTIYYPYGGSSVEHRNVMAANGLVWGIIKWAKQQGYEKFDMWGIDDPKSPEAQKQHGFSAFKTKFGGEIIYYHQSFDLVFDGLRYRLFTVGNKVRWGMLKMKKLVK